MARERYLLGVDPKELERRPESAEPTTPRGWWANFWYHNKWYVLAGLTLCLALFAFIWQSATRIKPDYLICMVATEEVLPSADERLEKALEEYAKDRNGDGKIRVEVQCLNIQQMNGDKVNEDAIADQQSAMAHLMTRDVVLWAVDPSYYSGTLSTAFNGKPESFFVPLTELSKTVDGVSDNLAYWDWTGSEIIDAEHPMDRLPKTLYWGVRVLPSDPTDEQRAEVEDMLEILQKFAKNQ